MTAMIFNDDSMLDVRGWEFGNTGFSGPLAADIGEVIITGRAPGSLYADDLSPGETFLEHILPFEFSRGAATPVFDLTETEAGVVSETLKIADATTDTVVPANDDEAPASLSLSDLGKDAEPLILIDGDNGAIDIVATDLHDLSIPPIPLSAAEAPVITVTPPTLDADPAPVIIGGRAYESLSFLIIDTPFAVGDSQLPGSLRLSIEELLGLGGSNSDDDDQAFVMPARSWVLG